MFPTEGVSVTETKRGAGKMANSSRTSPQSSSNTNKDVSSILDIAIIGFPKSGTTSMMDWLNASDEVYIDNREKTFLSRGDVNGLVQHFTAVNKKHPKVMNAIKFPGDIDTPNGLQTLEENFPNAKLIVMLRQPVLWFESFYNFWYRFKIDRTHKPFWDVKELVGSCRSDQTRYSCPGGEGLRDCPKGTVCTDRAQMHQAIARLALTPMTSSDELSLLGDFQMTVHPWKKPVLFIEVNQLAEGSDLFHQDVESFLGGVSLSKQVPHHHSNLPHVPGEIDICSSQYTNIRTILQEYAQKSSEWILKYLMESELAVVSNQTHFADLIKKWQSDPCEDRHTERMRNTSASMPQEETDHSVGEAHPKSKQEQRDDDPIDVRL